MILPAPLRGDAHDLPAAARLRQGRARRPTAPTPGPTTPTEELRLGYVAFTRAAHRLSVSSYCWSPRTTPYGPSEYQASIRDAARRVGRAGSRRGSTSPVEGRPQPLRRRGPVPAVAATGTGAEARLRIEAAALVRAADPMPRTRTST